MVTKREIEKIEAQQKFQRMVLYFGLANNILRYVFYAFCLCLIAYTSMERVQFSPDRIKALSEGLTSVFSKNPLVWVFILGWIIISTSGWFITYKAKQGQNQYYG